MARMVELRGVEAGFPLYGRVRLRGGQGYSHALLAERGALVRPELLTQLDLAVGDALVIGSQTFTIRGVLEGEPGGRTGGFSLGPRVLIDRAALEQAGLLGFGSRARHQIMLRVDPARLDAYTREVRQAFRNEFVNVRSWKSTESDIGEDLERSENYLSLVGLVVLVLGGIGVSSVTRVFVEQKLKSIAVLKCVGAHTAQILGVYMLQVLALGLAGSLLGVALARAALLAVTRYAVSTSANGRAADVRLDVAGGGAGRAHRPAGGAAVFDRAPPARPARAALVAVAAGRRRRRPRLLAVRRRSTGRRGAGRGGRLAGRLLARRPDRLRRFHRHRRPCCGAPGGCWSR